MMGVNRQQISDVYRPVGPKLVNSVAWTAGGTVTLAQQVDLSLPIRGLRLVFKGRVAVTTTNFASMTPEGILNLITEIVVAGQNKRVGGNATMYDLDLATLFVIQHFFEQAAAIYSDNGTLVATPTTPFANMFSGLIANHDFIIAVDLPFHPFDAPPGVRPQFIVRQDEWKDSISIKLVFGTQAGGVSQQGALGITGGGGGSGVAFTAFGSAAGTPTVDVYSLPVIMGSLKDGVIPGIMTRTQQPINTVLQAAGAPSTLATLEKMDTTRIYLKSGVSTLNPYFDSLNDTNVSAIGLILGGNRNVRNLADIFAHKQGQVNQYRRPPIQGYNEFDFIESGNPDSAYPGDRVGEGTTMQLKANVAGLANAYGIVIQEEALLTAEGSLYSF